MNKQSVLKKYSCQLKESPLTDRELILKIVVEKENVSYYKQILFFRYLAMILKIANTISFSSRSDGSFQFDDFISEAYLHFEKALSQIKIEKVINKPDWRFLHFKFHLRVLRANLLSKWMRRSKYRVDLQTLKKQDETFDLEKIADKMSRPPEEFLIEEEQKKWITSFFEGKKITNREKDFITERVINEKKLKEIAQQYNISAERARQIINSGLRKIKKIYVKEFL